MGYDEEIKYVRNMLMKHCRQYTACCLLSDCTKSGYVMVFFLWKTVVSDLEV